MNHRRESDYNPQVGASASGECRLGGILFDTLGEHSGANEIRVVPLESRRWKAAAKGDVIGYRWRFSRSGDAFRPQYGDRISMGSEPSKTAGDLTRIEVKGLLNLQRKFLRHYFRLQAAERRLSARALRRERGAGRLAILHVERERQRIGRELHTGVGQMLAAIRLQMELITNHLDNPSPAVLQAASRVNSLASEALDQVRSVSRRLHPPEWLRLDLETAVRQLWDISGVPEKYHGRIHIDSLPEDPDLEVKILIYRAMQEALSNISRHSHATRVEASLAPSEGTVVLRVTDNGVGFDPAKLASAPASVASGLGLRAIREQAAALGGKLALESGPSGTTLVLTAPLRASTE